MKFSAFNSFTAAVLTGTMISSGVAPLQALAHLSDAGTESPNQTVETLSTSPVTTLTAVSATTDVNVAKSQLDQANSELQQTKDALAKAQESKDAAFKEVGDAGAKLADAEAQQKTAADPVKTQAAAALAEKESEVTSCTNSYNAAKKALEKAESDYATAESNLDETYTAWDFFESLGSQGEDAIKVLNQAPYASYTKKGSKDDATSLSNMLEAVSYLEKFNALRASLGLSELQVNYTMMAISMSNTNYSAIEVGHSKQFSVAENLAWGYINPYDGWYTKEYDYYVAALSAAGYDTSLTPTQLKAQNATLYSDLFSGTNDSEKNPNRYVCGHYFNVVNPYYMYTGFACISNSCTTGQVFTGDSYAGPGYGKNLTFSFGTATTSGNVSLATYKAKLQAFVAEKEAQKAPVLVEEQAAVDAAKAAVDTAQKNLTAANEALTAAKKVLTWDNLIANGTSGAYPEVETALAQYNEASKGVASAQSALDKATAKYDAASADLLVAQNAYNSASSNAQQAQAIYDALVKGGEGSTGTGNGAGGEGSTSSATFPDVDQNDWYATYVSQAVELGMMNGYTNGSFGTYDKITRAQAVTVLYRAITGAKATDPYGTESAFGDVAANTYYTAAVKWAKEQGVTTGYADGTFRPDDQITRADLVTMIWRACGRPAAIDGGASYATCIDKGSEGSYATDALKWSASVDVMSGSVEASGKRFKPADNAARAEAAKMFVNSYTFLKR